MIPVASTPRWSFLHPWIPVLPCLTAAHSPSPKMARPLLSMTKSMRPGSRRSLNGRFKVPAPSGQSGVVRDVQMSAHELEDRKQEPLGLAERQMKEQAHGERGLNGKVGVLPLSTTTTRGPAAPVSGGVWREPDGEAPTLNQRSVVLGPVADAVLRLVLRMHSRLHAEILGPRSTGSPQSRRLVGRNVGFLHQRRAGPGRARPPRRLA